MNENRVNELVASMNSFGKEAYYKRELLDEMMALQSEIVSLTFNGEHAATADLKIWDVERHLEQLNEECGHVADEELNQFKSGCKVLCNLIKAEISGNRGEYKAFRTLDYIRTDHIILKNIELKDGDDRTELDAVVITPYGITIVEVKNTARDIFIDENGNYYRTGEFLNWDCNIVQKMNLKEDLLKRALEKEEFANVDINKIVVFTDNRIKVQNKCSDIKTSFASQLPYLIEGFKKRTDLTQTEMEQLEEVIKNAECKEAYPFEFDAAKYKEDFARLMVVLEDASAKTEEIPEIEEVNEKVTNSFSDIFKRIFSRNNLRYAGSAVAGVAVTLLTTAVIGSIRK